MTCSGFQTKEPSGRSHIQGSSSTGADASSCRFAFLSWPGLCRLSCTSLLAARKAKAQTVNNGLFTSSHFPDPHIQQGDEAGRGSPGAAAGLQYCSPYQSSSFNCRFSSPAKCAGLGLTHALEMTVPVEGDSELVQKERAPSPGDSGVLPPLFFPLHFQDINTLQMYWSGNNVSN